MQFNTFYAFSEKNEMHLSLFNLMQVNNVKLAGTFNTKERI